MRLKNVVGLFDGMSCGQLALEDAGITYDKYYASEIDKHAIQVCQENFPNTIQLGSVVDLNTDNLTDIDCLLGGSPCFVAGTPVICQNEIKPIQDVKTGDLVLTHKNRFKKVLRVGGKKQVDILEVKFQGLPTIGTTEEHPFYVLSSAGKKNKVRLFTEPYWKKSSELVKGDYLGLPILNTSENYYNLTEEECYIIGRYIADGHTRKDYRTGENRPNDRLWGLILSIGNTKVEIFKNKVVNNHFTCHPHSKSVYRCIFSNKRLVEIVEENCGCRTENKFISMKLLNLPKNLLAKLIEGYLDGDGSVKNETHKLTTVSDKLPLTMALAVAKVFRVGTSYVYTKRPPTCVIEGRTVNQRNTHVLLFLKTRKISSKYLIIDDTIWLPFKKLINTETKQDVYNIEVEEDNSYTAGGVIVHNCQSFSSYGDGSGFEGKSGLFWQYVRILKELNPKYFLLENVVMKKEWEDIITQAVGVSPIKLDSRLVSAQSRARLYWTNIPNITQPKDLGLNIKDVIDCKFSATYPNYLDLTFCGKKRKDMVKNYNSKASCLTASMYKGQVSSFCKNDEGHIYKYTPEDCEILQTVKRGYTSSQSATQRYKMLGNGWTIKAISHILSHIKD